MHPVTLDIPERNMEKLLPNTQDMRISSSLQAFYAGSDNSPTLYKRQRRQMDVMLVSCSMEQLQRILSHGMLAAKRGAVSATVAQGDTTDTRFGIDTWRIWRFLLAFSAGSISKSRMLSL
jgi:hypothetical protein